MSLATRCTACATVFRVVQDQLKVSEGWVRCGRCGSVFNALEGLFDLEPAALAASVAGGAAAPAAVAAAEAMVDAQSERLVETRGEEPAADALSEPPADAPTESIAEHPEHIAEPNADVVTAHAEPIAEPPAEAPAPPAEAPDWVPEPGSFTPPEPYVDAWPAPREPVFVEPQPMPHARGVHDATPASRVDEEDRIDFADARFNVELLKEAGIAAADSSLDPDVDNEARADAAAGTEAGASVGAGAAAEAADAEAPAPEFLREAERSARWTSPRARVGLALASVLLLALLGAQAALHYRDLVATLLPETRPALEAVCGVTGCSVEPLRRIDDIVIESSGLNALPGGETVRLSVVLRNRGVFPLAVPAIELTLTDAGGQMIARRVLPPADFGIAAAAVLPAASELPLQLVLGTSGRRASGYTVEPFYP